MIRFTRHAHDRLMERHGVLLTVEECFEVGAALQSAVVGQNGGTVDCDVTLRAGNLRFVARVCCVNRTIITVMHFGESSPGRKFRRQGRKLHGAFNSRMERDIRRARARKS